MYKVIKRDGKVADFDLKKIWGENFLRVLDEVEKIAE